MAIYMRGFFHVMPTVHHRYSSLIARNVHHGISSTLPVMLDQVLNHLDVEKEHTVLDMTFGAGGHSEAILNSVPGVKLLALDRDPLAFSTAEILASKYPGRVIPLFGCFSDLPQLLHSQKIEINSIDRVLIDLGCSNTQLMDAHRGFSTDLDGPLDMRMSGTEGDGITAADVIARADAFDLHRILKVYGGLKSSKKIANAIVTCRYGLTGIMTTLDLKNFVMQLEIQERDVVGRVFQAIRAFVNNEYNELNFAMKVVEKFLKKSGRIVVLTYNHEEDLIVKRHITGNVIENNPNPVSLKYYSQSLNLSSEEIEELRKSPWVSLSKHAIRDQGNMQNKYTKNLKMRVAMKL